MSLIALAYDPYSNPLNNNEWSFPLAECIHIASFALSIGTIVLVDLRLLGLGMKRETPAQIAKDTSLWTLAGLILVITSGLVIFSSDPIMYMNNDSFKFKVSALAVAILYNYTIRRKAAYSNMSGALGMMAGLFSLALWVSVVAGGIFIAFVG